MPKSPDMLAVLSLLDEPDVNRADSIVEAVARWPEDQRNELLVSSAGLGPVVRRNIEAACVRSRFARLSLHWQEAAGRAQTPLERMLMLLAETTCGTERARWASDRLDALASRVGARLGGDRAIDNGLAAIRSVLHDEWGLRGDLTDYYNPGNYYLPSVLERKSGVPVSLSCVALLVAQRLDLPVHGIGLPTHFVCFYGDPVIESGSYFDPFNEFRAISRAQAEAMLLRHGVEPNAAMFAPVSEREIVARTLRNLVAIYGSRDELEHAACIYRWLAELEQRSKS